MNIEMLPLDGCDRNFSVVACVDLEYPLAVFWGYSQRAPKGVTNPIELPTPEHGEMMFIVTRSAILPGVKTTVFVEACGWFGPDFKFRLELTTEQPEEAVRVAVQAAKGLE